MPTVALPFQSVNAAALDHELRAAIPSGYNGFSLSEEDGLLVHLADDAQMDTLRPTIVAVLAAHDPSALTPQQQAQSQQQAALAALTQTDFTAMTDAVQGAATLEDVRPLLLDALGALNALTLALGLKN